MKCFQRGEVELLHHLFPFGPGIPHDFNGRGAIAQTVELIEPFEERLRQPVADNEQVNITGRSVGASRQRAMKDNTIRLEGLLDSATKLFNFLVIDW